MESQSVNDSVDESFSSTAGDNEHVSVSVRMRPLWQHEQKLGTSDIWDCSSFSIKDNTKKKLYPFDHVFGPDSDSTTVFEKIGESLVWSAMDGFHGSIFCYGQTGSGKTFTMHGDSEHPGVIPQAIEDIFAIIEETPTREYLLRVSYLEIYNECINDLLSPTSTNLRIQEDPVRGVIVVGLKEEVATSAQQVYSLLSMGDANRHIGSTNFNEKSSRSHSVFRITIESKARQAKGTSPVQISTINLIDLAGSESGSAVKGLAEKFQNIRTKEMRYINKSLLTLGTVIMRLSGGSKNADWIPYRDSKLTRFLQPALSGNAKIAMICNVSPSLPSYEETVNTLKFAQRAKKIKSNAHKNEVIDDKALISRYRQEIDDLKTKLQSLETVLQREQQSRAQLSDQQGQDINTHALMEEISRLDFELEKKNEEKAALAEELNHIRNLIITSRKISQDEDTPPFDVVREHRRTRLIGRISHRKHGSTGSFSDSSLSLLPPSMLAKEASPRRSIEGSPSDFVETVEVTDESDQSIKSPDLQAQAQELRNAIEIAEKNFLLEQLREKDKRLADMENKLADSNGRVTALEEENAKLKKLLASCKTQLEALSKSRTVAPAKK
eukprot:GILK01010694.1.p1 GENE.GILK01010694.1~~GILK01010694.1.p1  ORF type:complete len:610 (-),score=148.16 GILK01010694.1:140-1969(-)